ALMLDDLVPGPHVERHGRQVEEFFRHPTRRPMGSGLALSARRKDGLTLPVDIALAPIETGSGRFVAAAVREGTDRRRDEQALRESQERFDLAVRGTDAGIWDWDLRDGRVFYSARWKSMLGCDTHEVADTLREWESRVHPDDLERALATINDYLAGR